MIRKITLVAAVAVLQACAVSAQNNTAPPAHEGPSISKPANDIRFFGSGVKTDKGELYAGPAYGDLQNGRHGSFVRMPHGFVSPVHTHTEDYYAVVIRGVGANQAPGGKVIPLPAGSYWFQKGEEPHVTQCVSSDDCLFFIVQPGKFDYVPTK